MKIEKLPSGSYRVRKMYKGKSYSLVFDYKPTQKEIIKELNRIMDESDTEIKNNNVPMTFDIACIKYFEVKSKVLSPSTLKGYKSIQKNLSIEFKKLRLSDISLIDIQKEINDYASSHSAKTTANANGFIISVMSFFYPNKNFKVTLPIKQNNDDRYIPSKEDVKKILDYAKGTKYEIPLWLACCGLRKSEVVALKLEDLSDDNIIRINKTIVKNDNNEWVEKKSTKTTKSTRDIVIPDYVANLIREQGYVYKGDPNGIWKALNRFQIELDMPHFSLHSLRHYFATMLTENGVSEADILKMGGWSTPNVMKTVYRHATIDKDRERQKKAINGLF